VPIVLKSGSLNLLEPSGPVKACNGIALPLPLPLHAVELHLSGLITAVKPVFVEIPDYWALL
jgi:hypothetical protein